MQRLKTRPQFQAALAGAIIAKTLHFALHRNSLDTLAGRSLQLGDADRPCKPSLPALFKQADAWLGAMVPKRWAKRAVTRNTIKRQIYTVSADFAAQYAQAAYVVRLRRDFSRTDFVSATSEHLKQAVCAELQVLMQAGLRVS